MTKLDGEPVFASLHALDDATLADVNRQIGALLAALHRAAYHWLELWNRMALLGRREHLDAIAADLRRLRAA